MQVYGRNILTENDFEEKTIWSLFQNNLIVLYKQKTFYRKWNFTYNPVL